MSGLAAVVAALEALDAGDVAYATRILENLEHGLRDGDDGRKRGRPCRCPNCGVAFRWPGELDTHLQFSSCWERPGKAAAA